MRAQGLQSGPCRVKAPRCQHPVAHRRLIGTSRLRSRRVIVRTSANWWEDEEEFDAVADTLNLLPKTLHILSLPDAAKSTPGVGGGKSTPLNPSVCTATISTAVSLLRSASLEGPLTAGFCTPQCTSAAQSVWTDLKAGGAPYFKKMREREAMAGSTIEDTDQFLTELLGQNWRVELDYGLQGVTLTPREHLLLVGLGHEVRTLLGELLSGEDVTEPVGFSPELWKDVALIQCNIRGTSEVSDDEDDSSTSGSTKLWRRLQPTLANVASRAAAEGYVNQS